VLESRQYNPQRVEEETSRIVSFGQEKNYELGAVHNENLNQPWTIGDIDLIMSPGRPRDRELSKILGRTVLSIQSQRCLQKKKKKE